MSWTSEHTSITFVHKSKLELENLFDGMIIKNWSDQAEKLEFAPFELSETTCTISHAGVGPFTYLYVTDLANRLDASEEIFKDKEIPWEYISNEGLDDVVDDYTSDLESVSELLEEFLPYINFESSVEPLATYESSYGHSNMGRYNRLFVESVLEIKKPRPNSEEENKGYNLIFDTSTSVQIGEWDLKSEENTLESILNETDAFYGTTPLFLRTKNFSISIFNRINISIYDDHMRKPIPVLYRCENLKDGTTKSSFRPNFKIVKKTLLGNT